MLEEYRGLVLETKDFLAHGTASSMSFMSMEDPLATTSLGADTEKPG